MMHLVAGINFMAAKKKEKWKGYYVGIEVVLVDEF